MNYNISKGESMKRCADGCKFLNERWNKNWCDLKGKEVKNTGNFCSKFIPETRWSRFIKWLGF